MDKMMRCALLLLFLACLSSGQELTSVLREYVTNFQSQTHLQVTQTRAKIAESGWSGVQSLILEVDDAVRLVQRDIEGLRGFLVDLPEECEANLPITPDVILTNADQILNDCIQEVWNTVELEDNSFETVVQDYERNATGNDFWFLQKYFRKLDTPISQGAAMLSEIVSRAVLWDNQDSIELYNNRELAKSHWNFVTEELDRCSFNAKEYVGSAFGSVFLYLWEC